MFENDDSKEGIHCFSKVCLKPVRFYERLNRNDVKVATTGIYTGKTFFLGKISFFSCLPASMSKVDVHRLMGKI